MEEVIRIMEEIGLSYAYDHFAEGESPDPPFICYLLPEDDNFAADGVVYYKVSGVRIELYTDFKNPAIEEKVRKKYVHQWVEWYNCIPPWWT